MRLSFRRQSTAEVLCKRIPFGSLSEVLACVIGTGSPATQQVFCTGSALIPCTHLLDTWCALLDKAKGSEQQSGHHRFMVVYVQVQFAQILRDSTDLEYFRTRLLQCVHNTRFACDPVFVRLQSATVTPLSSLRDSRWRLRKGAGMAVCVSE
jgi:hypothetical protein